MIWVFFTGGLYGRLFCCQKGLTGAMFCFSDEAF